ncbi:MAG: DNA circularization N-terminal domain-containing protein [Bacteroidota bacterium]
MAIELGGIALDQVHRITTHEDGAYLMQRVPGLEGDIAQDFGRQSLRLDIEGIFYGEEITKELQSLRELYLKREPVELLAQVAGRAYASNVLIDHLQVMESGDQPDQYTYHLVVVEYVEPPTSGLADVAAVNTAIAAEALAINELMELPDMLALGSLPELSNPIAPLKGVLAPMQEASTALLKASSGLTLLFGKK